MSDTVLSRIDPRELSESRLVAHWALQVPAAVSSALATVREDDSHSNFGWTERHGGALLGHPLTSLASGAGATCRVALCFEPLSIVVVRDDGGSDQLGLEGQTLASALSWTRDVLAGFGSGDADPSVIELRDYEMPPHPLADGGVFEPAALSAELAQLRDWFASFSRCFARLVERVRDADPARFSVDDARVWPHHFDLGGLATVSEDDSVCADESSRPSQLGFGLSPGDDTFEQPYVYVTPYPGPPETQPWKLPSGWQWESDAFSGAVLLGEVAARLDEEVLQQQVEDVVLAGLRIDRT